jgi:hypothetical protein
VSYSDDLLGGFFIAHRDVFGMPLLIGPDQHFVGSTARRFFSRLTVHNLT